MMVLNEDASKELGRDNVVVDFYPWNLSDCENEVTMTMGCLLAIRHT
jgi:hypothetical protein